jgi:hypothetical protein
VEDTKSKLEKTEITNTVLDEEALKLSQATNLTLESVETLRQQLKDHIKVGEDDLLALKNI